MKIKYKGMILLIVAVILLIGSISLGESMLELREYGVDRKIELNGEVIEIPRKVENLEEEFRGVWVSTVYNLDFPSKKGLSEKEFKEEFSQLLDNVEELKLNSLIFQVRPKGDAFYESEINPWSEYLTGKEGKSPGWDPLEWMIDETHKRGLEFQAWFNPYRVTTSHNDEKSKVSQLEELSDKNWARQNPRHVFKYKGKLYLDPASEEVRKHVNASIMEVVYKYDIDAVHLDDYFYPTKASDDIESFYSNEEMEYYNKTGDDYDNISDWRRDNVNKLVEMISKSIDNYNKNNQKSVEFGISPFGIWGHLEDYPEDNPLGPGSRTPRGSLSSYDRQFVDSKKWVEEGWVDYIAPQIYWTFDSKAAPYANLVDWWAQVVKDSDVKLYIGHANYMKHGNKGEGSWSNPMEIFNQIAFNRRYKEVKGDVFFRYKSLLEEEGKRTNNSFIKRLKRDVYKDKVKLPKKKNKDLITIKDELKSPYDLRVDKQIYGNQISWKDHRDNPSNYYIVVREETLRGRIVDKKVLTKVIRKDKENYISYLDREAAPNKNYSYYVAAVTDCNKESLLAHE